MNKLIDKFITFSFQHRFVTLGFALSLIIGGYFAFKTLDTEAYPEFTAPYMQVITQLSGKGAEEVERLVTIPLEKELNGIPGETNLRSISIFGLSVITVKFDENNPVSLDRQRVLERISQANLPDGVTPQISPEAGAVGEIYRYTLESRYYSPMTRKAIEDWQMERAFKQIPGVIDVSSFGGPTKTYRVNIDPKRLFAVNVTLSQVYQALSNANITTGGNYIEHNDRAFVVRGMGLFKSLDDIKEVVITATPDGKPIRIGDVAEVNVGPGIRLGQFGKNEDDDAVMGIVLMRRGENPSKVVHRLYEKFPEIQKILPDGIKLMPLYDRNFLVQETLETIGHNVLEGISLVLIVLVIFLGDLQSGLITATVIPFALLIAFICLKVFGIPANLLSLGAIDFGIIVDGAVVMVENAFSVLANPALIDASIPDTRKGRLKLVLESSKQMGKPILFATIIIMMAFAPIFAFSGVAGKLFHPLAFTMNFALIGAVIASLTIIPVFVGLWMTGKSRIGSGHHEAAPGSAEAHGGESGFIKIIHIFYDPLIKWALKNPWPMIGLSALALVGALILFTQTGSEFLPALDEGNIWVRATIQPTSGSLENSVAVARRIRQIIMQYPEIKNVATQTGSSDDGLDPNLFSNIEGLVDLKSADEWRPRFHRSKPELIAAMDKDLSVIPNVDYYFSQYIQDNVDEAVAGAKGNLVVKIFGPDLKPLQRFGDKVAALIRKVPGMVDVSATTLIGQPQYEITLDRPRASRYGLNMSDIQAAMEIAVGGKVATQFLDGEIRYNVMARLAKPYRNSQQMLQSILLDPPGPMGAIPLSEVATVTAGSGATMINREQNARLVIVKANVRGRDLGSTVEDAQKLIGQRFHLPEGYHIQWGGQYEYQQESNQRLLLVVPLAILLIFLVLWMTFGSVSNALLVLSAVPLAVIGGIVALWVTHTYFSISAGVGFIALFGVAVQNGVIKVSYINYLREHHHMRVADAVFEGAITRMRPVLMTATVAILGLMPAALSNGIGSQSQKPFAIVIIGGLVSSTFLTLLVLPTLYKLIEKDPPPEPLTMMEAETF